MRRESSLGEEEKQTEPERQRDRASETETDRQTDRQTERERERARERERERERERGGERERESEHITIRERASDGVSEPRGLCSIGQEPVTRQAEVSPWILGGKSSRV